MATNGASRLNLTQALVGYFCVRILADTLQQRLRHPTSRPGASTRLARLKADFLRACMGPFDDPGGGTGTAKHTQHIVHKYVNAYASRWSAPSGRQRAAERVDERAFAEAYALLNESTLTVAAPVLRQLGVRRLLDLGCGPAAMLCHLARADRNFRGWGIESNAHLAKVARKRVKQMQLGRRVQIICGDAATLAKQGVPPSEKVDAIFCGSLLNSYLEDRRIVGFLRQLATAYPGRTLIVKDYYGRLGRRSPLSLKPSLGLVHDLVQAVSGQSVPPANYQSWARLYGAARARLLYVLDGHSDELDWFIHVVRLPD